MLLLSLLMPAALANGQTTHIWICHEALDALPEGPLRELLSREDLDPYFTNGAMFPDGGYAVGHPYGEAAHWEPFQDAYRAWIADSYEQPYSDEAAQHVAFLMGLACHGMADQVFDSLFMEYSRVYDAEYGWADDVSMDEATDVEWAHLTGAQTPPDAWFPGDLFVELFAGQGIDVGVSTMADGQDLLRTAVAFVGAFGENDAAVAKYEAQFPWATANMDAPVPGAPSFEAVVVARYWQDLWARLGVQAPPYAIIGSNPAEGGYDHPTDATMPESRVSVILGRGAYTADIDASYFSVVDSQGNAYAVEPNLFYGNNSHAINLQPALDWPDDEDFTLTVKAGLPMTGGESMEEDQVLHFSTGPAPEIVEDTGDLSAPGGCGCGSAAAPRPAGLALVGAFFAVFGLRRKNT